MTRCKRWGRAALVVALASWMGACGGEGAACEHATDCPADHACVFEQCVPRMGGCVDDRDCPSGFACSEGACIARAACTLDRDCPDGQECQQGNCRVPAPTTCTSDADCPGQQCNLTSGVCEPIPGTCTADVQCDDADPCTLDACSEGECVHGPDASMGCCEADADCLDANPCTDDSCGGDQRCVHAKRADCCASDADCADQDACTKDRCVSQRCYHPVKPDGVQCGCMSTGDCDDGNPCTIDSCLSAVCGYQKNPNSPSIECCALGSACDDGDPSTLDSCAPDLFLCDHVLQAACTADSGCDDGNPCTRDLCQQGFCASEDAGIVGCCANDAQCDDGKDDTVDSCKPDTHTCAHLECVADGDCDDGNADTVDRCVDQVCTHTLGCSSAAQCDDENPCTTDTCNAQDQCQSTPIADCCTADADCDDADWKTDDRCVAGSCQHVAKPSCASKQECDDGYRCTDDVCYQSVCDHYPNLDDPACDCVGDAACLPTKNTKDVVCNLHIGSLPDPLHHVCTEVVGPNLGGQSCAWDSQCKSGFCMDLTGGQVCYGSCLVDNDCAPGALCGQVNFSASNGETFGIDACVPEPNACLRDAACAEGYVCTPSQDLETPNQAAGYCAPSQGAGAIGAPCVADGDCASGVCRNLGSAAVPDNRCIGVCQSTADCYQGTACYPNIFYFIFAQGTTQATDDKYDAWPVCFPDMGSFGPCASDAQCPAGETCDLFNNDSQTVFDPRCVTQKGSGKGGAACTVDTECRSGYCVGKGEPAPFCFGLCSSVGDCASSGLMVCQDVELTVNDRNNDDSADDIVQGVKVCVP